MDIDALGTFTMSHAALQYLKKGGQGKSSLEGGVILNISATLHYSAEWYQIHVSAAKVSLLVSLCVGSLINQMVLSHLWWVAYEDSRTM